MKDFTEQVSCSCSILQFETALETVLLSVDRPFTITRLTSPVIITEPTVSPVKSYCVITLPVEDKSKTQEAALTPCAPPQAQMLSCTTDKPPSAAWLSSSVAHSPVGNPDGPAVGWLVGTPLGRAEGWELGCFEG